MIHEKQKWVIVFLVYADFTLGKSNISPKGIPVADSLYMSKNTKIGLNSIFKDILTTPISSDTAKLFVVFESISYLGTEGDFKKAAFYFELEKKKLGKGNDFKDFKVIDKKKGRVSNNNPKSKELNTLQNKKKLAEVLQTIDVNPDEEVFLITYDHGTAFGIFEEQTPGLSAQTILEDEDFKGFYYLKRFYDYAKGNQEGKYIIDKKKEALKQFLLVKSDNKLFQIPTKNTIENIRFDKFFNLNVLDKFNLVETDKNSSNLVLKKNAPEFFLSKREEFIDRAFANKKAQIVADLPNQIPVQIVPNEILKNSELAYAINSWLKEKGKKVGVLLMNNCYMMNLHTQYALLGKVKCLVATPGDIDQLGYNYKEILDLVYKQKDGKLTSDVLATSIVTLSSNENAKKSSNKFQEKAIFSLPEGVNFIDKRTMIAMNLENVSLFKQFFVDLNTMVGKLEEMIELDNNAIKQNEITIINLIKFIRLISYDFTATATFNALHIIDIVNWLLAFYNISPLSPSKKKNFFPTFQRLHKFWNDKSIIIKKFPGPLQYLTDTSVSVLTNLEATGFGLFFPNTSITIGDKLIDDNFLDIVKSDALFKYLSNWKSLLHKLYGNIIPDI